MQMSHNSSTSDSSTDSPKWQISMRICEGAHEDCSRCNGDEEDRKHGKSLISIGAYADPYGDDEDDSNSNPSIESEVDSPPQTESETKSESLSSADEEEQDDEEEKEETHSVGTDFTYDEIDTETGNITRHCPSSTPLHPFLWRGREFLREDNQHTYIQTPESCEESVKVWAPSIAYVRDEFLTFNLCKKAVIKYAYTISCINRRALTPEEYYSLALIAAKENGHCLRDIPGDIQTQELCNVAVESSCWALPFCYRDFRSPAICLLAVSGNGQTLQHVPEEHVTYELCLAAIKSGYECMEFIPKEHITYELCKAAVEASGMNAKYIPEECMSTELGLIAVQSSGSHLDSMAGNNLRFIPSKYITKEILCEALKRWPHAYTSVSKEILTDEINDAILEAEPMCIAFMDQTPRLLLKAIQIRLSVIQFIKKSKITKEMAKYMISLPDASETFDQTSLDYLKTLIE
jgi:hypothetical protein